MVDKTSKSASATLDNDTTDADSTDDNLLESTQPTDAISGSEVPVTEPKDETISEQTAEAVATPVTNSTSSPAEVNTPMTDNPTPTQSIPVDSTATNNVSAIYGNYENYQLMPDAPWPPPIFVRQDISPQERYYIEHRWYSQWTFFDSKATENKNRYYRTQLIVGLGSVTVPVLVGINADGVAGSALYIITVIISLGVAMSTAIESLYTFGDNWRSYRSAAEDLRQEKSLYDVKAGRYANNQQAFIRFVERCEEIIAQQNGRWIQSQEKSSDQAKDQADEFLTSIGVDEYGNKINATVPTTTAYTDPNYATPVDSSYATPTEAYVDPTIDGASETTSVG